jgi:hypothetical protein
VRTPEAGYRSVRRVQAKKATRIRRTSRQTASASVRPTCSMGMRSWRSYVK